MSTFSKTDFSKVKAIIFDCDGILVDSEPISNRVLAEEITKAGMPMTYEESLDLFVGGSLADAFALVEKEIGKPLPADFESAYRQKTSDAFRKELKAIEGVEALIQSLSIPFCVGSNGPLEKVKLNLGITNLIQYFEDRMFSAYDIGAWKPDPQLFLHGAKHLGVAPENCLVLEDSIHGIGAAKNANMQALGYTAASNGFKLLDTGVDCFDDMEDLIPFLS